MSYRPPAWTDWEQWSYDKVDEYDYADGRKRTSICQECGKSFRSEEEEPLCPSCIDSQERDPVE